MGIDIIAEDLDTIPRSVASPTTPAKRLLRELKWPTTVRAPTLRNVTLDAPPRVRAVLSAVSPLDHFCPEKLEPNPINPMTGSVENEPEQACLRSSQWLGREFLGQAYRRGTMSVEVINRLRRRSTVTTTYTPHTLPY